MASMSGMNGTMAASPYNPYMSQFAGHQAAATLSYSQYCNGTSPSDYVADPMGARNTGASAWGYGTTPDQRLACEYMLSLLILCIILFETKVKCVYLSCKK